MIMAEVERGTALHEITVTSITSISSFTTMSGPETYFAAPALRE